MRFNRKAMGLFPFIVSVPAERAHNTQVFNFYACVASRRCGDGIA